MLTGDRPTGRSPGSLLWQLLWSALDSKTKHTNIIIADHQAITDRYTYIADNVYNMVIDYLAWWNWSREDYDFHAFCSSSLNQLMLPFLCLLLSLCFIEIQPLRQSRKHLAMPTGLLLTDLQHQARTLFLQRKCTPLLVATVASHWDYL